MLRNSFGILHCLCPVTKVKSKNKQHSEILNRFCRTFCRYTACSHILQYIDTYIFWSWMNFWESAIISGMVPRTGRLPLPSLRTKAFTACNITQKDGVWWTYRSNKSQHDTFEWSNQNMCLHLMKTVSTCDVRLLHCSLLKRSSTTLGIWRSETTQ